MVDVQKKVCVSSEKLIHKNKPSKTCTVTCNESMHVSKNWHFWEDIGNRKTEYLSLNLNVFLSLIIIK